MGGSSGLVELRKPSSCDAPGRTWQVRGAVTVASRDLFPRRQVASLERSDGGQNVQVCGPALLPLELLDLDFVSANRRSRELDGRGALRLTRRQLAQDSFDDHLAGGRFDLDDEGWIGIVFRAEDELDHITQARGLRLTDGLDFADIVGDRSGHVDARSNVALARERRATDWQHFMHEGQARASLPRKHRFSAHFAHASLPQVALFVSGRQRNRG